MKRDDVITFLGYIGVPKQKITTRSGWVLAPCPLAPWNHQHGVSGPDVFGVKLDEADGFVNCFACQYHGQQSDLLIEIHRLNKKNKNGDFHILKARELIEKAESDFVLDNLDSPDIEEVLLGGHKKFTEFPDWWINTFPQADTIPWATEYLQNRGVPLDVVHAFELRADTDQKRICFPVKDFAGVHRGLHGRAVLEQVEPRYRMYTYQKLNNPLIWLGEHSIDLDKPIVVAEGPFDMASIYRVYRNVASPLFANPSFEKMKRMAAATELVTFLDVGTGGDMGRKRFKEGFPGIPVRHAYPTKGKKDPGEMSVEELASALEKLVTLDTFLID